MSDEEIAALLDDALRLCQSGALTQAEQIYREVIAASPETADAWNNLALIYYQQDRLDEAAAAAECATQLRPHIPQYWLTRGNIELAQHRDGNAQDSFGRAIELAPDFAEAHFRRALGFHREYRIAEAIATYREALRLAPEVAEIHFQLAEALTLQARYDEAIRAYQNAFMRDAGGELDRRRCFECMRHLQFESLPDFWRMEIMRFFARPDIDKTRYIDVGLKTLTVQYGFRAALAAARQADAGFSAASVALRDVMRDGLFLLLLRDALIADCEFENFLTRLRAGLLLDEGLRAQAPLEFLGALAVQCFNTEYVYAESAAENARLDGLQRAVADGMQPGRPVAESIWRSAAVLAMYRPPGDVAGMYALAEPVPAALAPLVERTVNNVARERGLRQEIRAVGQVSDEVSREVRGMYEEHPYPRWFALNRWPAIPYAEWLAREVPMLAGRRDLPAAPRILVAGCGTGQDALWLATDIVGARVLAVDLSLSSLAYAQRMANELGVTNIEFRQCDILGLGALAEKFDLVYTKGVLHHMREPVAGARSLAGMLSPGGLLKAGVYSERARASVNAARAIIRERQIAPTAAAIRELRQYILESPQDSPLRPLVACADFYSTSMCRDLMFHVQEHQFRLPQVVAMLSGEGLAVLGLSDLPRNAVAAYCEMFPGAEVAANFQNWDAFEQRHPQTFMNMYQVWCRSPGLSADSSITDARSAD